MMMGPKIRPSASSQRLRAPREDEEDLRAALEEAAQKKGRVLTAEELKHWAETGEWPEGSD